MLIVFCGDIYTFMCVKRNAGKNFLFCVVISLTQIFLLVKHFLYLNFHLLCRHNKKQSEHELSTALMRLRLGSQSPASLYLLSSTTSLKYLCRVWQAASLMCWPRKRSKENRLWKSSTICTALQGK